MSGSESEPKENLSHAERIATLYASHYINPDISPYGKEKMENFAYGAHSTVKVKELWKQRYEIYYKFKHPGEEITISDKLAIDFLQGELSIQTLKGKSPNIRTFQGAVTILITYSKFYHNVTLNEVIMNGWIDNRAREGKLLKGYSRERSSLSTSDISDMLRENLIKAKTEGVLSWDKTILQNLAMSIMSGTACRKGEVIASDEDSKAKGYYLKYEDIEISCSSNTTKDEIINTLTCKIKILHTKGFKDRGGNNSIHLNYDNIYPCHPLKFNNHMCMVSNLITHALRHGLIVGKPKSLDDLLSNMLDNGGVVEWSEPKFPIICAINGNGQLELETPCGKHFINYSLKGLATDTRIANYVAPHHIRFATLTDLSGVPSSVTDGVQGYVSSLVQNAAGHSHGTVQSGVTQRYIGRPKTHLANVLEEYCNDPERITTRRTEEIYKKRKVTEISSAEIDAMIQKEEGNPFTKHLLQDYKHKRQRAIDNIRREDLAKFNQSTKKLTTAEYRAKIKGKEKVYNFNHNSSSPLPHSTSFGLDTSLNSLPSLPSSSSSAASALPSSSASASTSSASAAAAPTSIITTATTTECELEENEEDVDSLEITISQADIDAQDEEDNNESSDKVNNEDIPRGFKEYINYFSKINIVLSDPFVRLWPKYKSSKDFTPVKKYASIGNSRDDPSPFMYKCKNSGLGCLYTFPRKDTLQIHEGRCTELKIKKLAESQKKIEKLEPYECDICGKSYKGIDAIKQHKKKVHKMKTKGKSV